MGYPGPTRGDRHHELGIFPLLEDHLAALENILETEPSQLPQVTFRESREQANPAKYFDYL
jgi:hypothetical protein